MFAVKNATLGPSFVMPLIMFMLYQNIYFLSDYLPCLPPPKKKAI